MNVSPDPFANSLASSSPSSDHSRILGIDPGLNKTGFGLIDLVKGRPSFVATGVIRVPGGSLAERLVFIHRHLSDLVLEYRPTRAVIEKVFVNVNPQSTLLLGQARGAAICAAAIHGLDVHEYTPTEIKKVVAGHGKADKKEIQLMVSRALALEKAPAQDAADALACALCDAHMQSGVAAAIRRAGSLATAAATGPQSITTTNRIRHRGPSGSSSRSAWTLALADRIR